ncbi:MAG: DUF1840 domain-containing protein [Xenophilus sp.]
MLYRFKSQASAEVVMLEANARQLLDIIGKPAASAGVITVDQMAGAMAALEAAVAREARDGKHNRDPNAVDDHDEQAERQRVSLHQRATPLLNMLRESLAEKRDIVWGT